MTNKLIELNNGYVKFELNRKIYLIPRKYFEKKFKGVYWGMGNLYNEIIRLVTKSRFWLMEYRVK